MAQKIDYLLAAPEDIESALGHRLEQLRLARNISQSSLAHEAGVSRRTITRLENGGGVSLDTFIRVLRALGIVDRLDTLFPDITTRPVDRIGLGGRERKRARMKQKPEAASWTWETETEGQ